MLIKPQAQTPLPTAPSTPPRAVRPDAPSGTVKVHYHRWDAEYERADLWTWDVCHHRQPANQAVPVSATDDFGVVFVLNIAEYGTGPADERAIGFIPRLHASWDFRDGSDRFWRPEMGSEIWILEGDHQIYLAPPDISPRITKALLEDRDRVRVCLSHPMRTRDIVPSKFLLLRQAGLEIPIRSVAPVHPVRDRARIVELRLAEPIRQANEWVEARVQGYLPASVIPGSLQHDAELYSTNLPLGATYTRESTVFRVFSPAAVAISVVLFDDATGNAGRREVRMTPHADGVWQAKVAGDLEGMHYLLRVRTNLDERAREVLDPHAVNTTGTDSHARIANLRATDPPGFRPIKRPALSPSLADAVIYEAHVRDFTIHPDSGVQARGKFTGFVERGTVWRDDPLVRTGLDHLKELGVTHVQLLPVQDFDNDEDNPAYNWGYMTAFFNSPDGWFASDIRGDARIREFKQLVKGLHDAGIGVIMDVVYNHTGTQNTFEAVAPGYYHRLRDNGNFWNGSGCGNEVKSEAPMARRFILDSLKYWVEEYGVDGFRFDLMGLIDLETLEAARRELLAIHPGILLYGEPWTAGESGIARVTDKGVAANTGIGAFNDNFRNALKGEPNGSHAAYVQTGSHRGEVMKGIAGSIDDWARHPVDSINYATCHDNLTLWDKLEVSSREPEAQRLKMHLLTIGILAVSQGAFFLHGGEEFLRTKGGDHNSYDAGDAVNRFDWGRKKTFLHVHEYTRGLVAIRRAHPVFRLGTADEVRARLRFTDNLCPSTSAISFTLDGSGLAGETWERAAVFINPGPGPCEFRLPFDGEANLYVLGEKASATPIRRVKGSVYAPGRSMVIAAV